MRVAASHKTQRAGAVSEALKQGDDKRIVLPLQRAVADLEDIEKLGHALDEFVEAGGVRKVVEEVIEHEEEVVPPEILDHLLAVRAESLNVPVLRFVVTVDPDVDGVPEPGQVGAHLFAHHKVGKVAELVQQLEAPVE